MRAMAWIPFTGALGVGLLSAPFFQVRSTRVFVKQNGHWRLAHTQFSPIVEAPPAVSQ
jgi:hypothetical protein